MQKMCEDKYGCSKAEGKKHREGNLERSGCRSRSSRPPLSWQFWCPGEDVFPLSPPLHMCSWSPFVRIGMNWAYIAFADLGHNCQLNTCTTWDLWVKFYLGQNENCSPRVSTSESSERLLSRVFSRGRSVYKILVKGKFSAIKHSFYKRFHASHKELMSPWRGLVLF